MRFGPDVEARVLGQLAEHPDAHLTFPDDAYTEQGRVLINRDNRTMSLHRWLHHATTGEVLDPKLYLLRTCDEPGCQNPRHHTTSHAPRLPDPDLFWHGPPRPTRAEILSARTHCPQGHEYTRENTYTHTQRDGYRRRFCRACRRERAANLRRTT